jgi:hypothetical protein
MIEYFLGIITGVVGSLILVLVGVWSIPKTERQIRQIQSKIKQKGSILKPESEELGDWIDSLRDDMPKV